MAKDVSKLLKKANKLMESNEYDEAEPILLVAQKYVPDHPEVIYLSGEVYCKQQ